MTRLRDGIYSVEITMMVWKDGQYSPDFSQDFFGPLPYDADYESYIVEDVDYCIEQAIDWEHGLGDYENDCNEERWVEINKLV